MPSRPRMVVAGVAVALVAAVAVAAGSLAARRPAPSTVRTAATPTASATDPAVATYVAMVNSDDDTVDVLFFKKFTCKSRALCIGELQDMRAATVKFLSDVSAAPPPPVFAGANSQIKAAALQFVAQIDAAIRIMGQADSDYVAEAGTLSAHDLELAAGTVICWPRAPVWYEGGESAIGYLCR